MFQQEIPDTDQVQFMLNCLSGIAQEYFYSTVRNTAGNSEMAFNMISDEFTSKQHQSQALAYVRRLSFSGIKNEKSCSNIEALAMAHSCILEYIPQWGPSYQNEHQEGHMSEFLPGIVGRQPWDEHVLTAQNIQNGREKGIDSLDAMLVSALTLVDNR